MIIEKMLNPDYELKVRLDSFLDLLVEIMEDGIEIEKLELPKAS